MSSPADAQRKADKAKNKNKNKKARADKKTLALVKQNTRDLETDIFELEQLAKRGPLSVGDKSKLDSFKSELSYVNKAKEKFVKDHPEQKNLVNRHTGVWPRALAAAAKLEAEELDVLPDGFPADDPLAPEFELPEGPPPPNAKVGPRIKALLDELEAEAARKAAEAPILPNTDTSMPFVQLSAPSGSAQATVMGAPQLRDLKREATAFVPNAVKRQRN